MLVDLTDICEMQIKLDKDIHVKHNVDYHSVINEIILALLVELGEFANEVRCFKFWSNKSSSKKNIILEEYVDGIHFLTSMCIRENIECKFEINDLSLITDKKIITKLFNNLFVTSNELIDKQGIINWYQKYLELGYKLGFNVNEIKQAYLLKNKINFERQLNNY